MNAPDDTTHPKPAANETPTGGTLDDIGAINSKLRQYAEKCILLSPATRVSRLPSGCVISFNVIVFTDSDTYDVGGGKRGLLRSALLRLAPAAGIVWRTSASGRTDDGRHPHVVSWHAEGAWRGLDGAWVPVAGDACLDLRDGSAATQKVLESARGNTEQERETKGRISLRDIRSKILERAQSAAENRAIRQALGIRSYTPAELAKPFVIARLSWVGTDAADDRAAIRESFLGATSALYGGAPPARMLAQAPRPAAAPALPAHTPEVSVDGEILDDGEPEPGASPWAEDSEPAPANGASYPPPDISRGPADAPSPAAARPSPGAAVGAGARSGPIGVASTRADDGHAILVIPGGDDKGLPLDRAPIASLEYSRKRISESLAGGMTGARFVERDKRLLAGLEAELDRRGATSERRATR